MSQSPTTILHDADSAKFYTESGAYLLYSRKHDTLSIDHTFVPDQLRGQKLAERLLLEALAYSESIHAKVRPECSYAQAYIDKNRQYQHLVEPQSRPQ